MSAYVYELGARPSSRARRSRERRALTQRPRRSPESRDPRDPKRKLSTLALVGIPLMTATLSLTAALLGLFPATSRPVPAPILTPRPVVSLHQGARSLSFASYGLAHFSAATVSQQPVRPSASVTRHWRGGEHAPQLASVAVTLSVHFRVHSGTHATTVTFTTSTSATSSKGLR